MHLLDNVNKLQLTKYICQPQNGRGISNILGAAFLFVVVVLKCGKVEWLESTITSLYTTLKKWKQGMLRKSLLGQHKKKQGIKHASTTIPIPRELAPT